eukprot:GHVR01039750.1.p1 GENE.GHVR01039750.1~~GHVR01039750.1.p1  ORF type:complete len:245 (+),score=56.77 GHVR01039750.1:32-766(+)
MESAMGPVQAGHLAELDIPIEMQRDLIACGGTDIVVIADDSGSMNARAGGGKTRWDELKQTLESLLHLLLAVDHKNGFHICFLNHPKFINIISPEQIINLFESAKPANRTPLKAALESVFRGDWNPCGISNITTDVIVLVMTDGMPSDCSFDGLKVLISRRPRNYFVSFLMCTDEDEIVMKFNRCIDPIPGCDISDDYKSEKNEVKKAGGTLSYNEWLVKCVLGGKFPKYDRKDEKNSNCCVLQ